MEALFAAVSAFVDDLRKGWRKDGVRGALRDASAGLWFVVVLLVIVGIVLVVIIPER